MTLKIKKVLKAISNTFIAIVIVLIFLLYGVRLFSLKPYTVLSGSMERVYPTGSMIYVAKVDPAELKEQDVITFKMENGAIATHRIVELVPDEKDSDIIRFRTKGDENEIADATLVNFSSVVGQPRFCIPYLGYLATFMMQPFGKLVVIAVMIVMIFLDILVGQLLGDQDKKKPETEQN